MAALKIETLLAKFGCKGQSYGKLAGAGSAMFTVEEQLAIVGICWHKSPAGWLCLMVECLKDNAAYHDLLTIMKNQANNEITMLEGAYSPNALIALSVTAIAESTQLNGLLCGECSGTAIGAKYKCHHKSKCSCKTGRIPWTDETRRATFFHIMPITHNRFSRYKPVLANLVAWLTQSRAAALLSIKDQLERETEEAKKVA